MHQAINNLSNIFGQLLLVFRMSFAHPNASCTQIAAVRPGRFVLGVGGKQNWGGIEIRMEMGTISFVQQLATVLNLRNWSESKFCLSKEKSGQCESKTVLLSYS